MILNPLRSFSALALDLYRACRDTPVERFQQWAMDRLKADLSFDAGKWVSGHMEGRVPVTHSVKLINRPQEMHADYDRIKHQDFLAKDTVANFNRALLFNHVAEHPEAAPEIRSYLQKWRTSHVAVCARVDPFTDLATGIALWREARDAPFGEEERRLFEAVVPHLIESFAINRLTYVVRAAQPGNSAALASAVCDAKAQLQVAPPEFQRLLLAEWPAWRGRVLPEPLGSLLCGQEAARYAGERIAVRATRMNDGFLVQARERKPVDSLSEREVEIARLCARGLTYKRIAQQLSIAPGTVRTHIAGIFVKLRINKQSEIARALGDRD